MAIAGLGEIPTVMSVARATASEEVNAFFQAIAVFDLRLVFSTVRSFPCPVEIILGPLTLEPC
jgi:hypothetical protein